MPILFSYRKMIFTAVLCLSASISMAQAAPIAEETTAPAAMDVAKATVSTPAADQQPAVAPGEMLNQPNATDAQIVEWARRVALLPYQYNYETYQKNLTQASLYFTKDAWYSVEKSLRDANLLGDPTKNHFSVSAHINGPARLVKKGIVNGRFAWKVSVPVSLNYSAYGMPRRRTMILLLTILRVPSAEFSHGVRVARCETLVLSVVDNGTEETVLRG